MSRWWKTLGKASLFKTYFWRTPDVKNKNQMSGVGLLFDWGLREKLQIMGLLWACCGFTISFSRWIVNWKSMVALKPVFNSPHFEKAHFAGTTAITTAEHNTAQSVVHVKWWCQKSDFIWHKNNWSSRNCITTPRCILLVRFNRKYLNFKKKKIILNINPLENAIVTMALNLITFTSRSISNGFILLTALIHIPHFQARSYYCRNMHFQIAYANLCCVRTL